MKKTVKIVCKRCLKQKPPEAFSKHAHNATGRQTYCKLCISIMRKERAAKLEARVDLANQALTLANQDADQHLTRVAAWMRDQQIVAVSIDPVTSVATVTRYTVEKVPL